MKRSQNLSPSRGKNSRSNFANESKFIGTSLSPSQGNREGCVKVSSGEIAPERRRLSLAPPSPGGRSCRTSPQKAVTLKPSPERKKRDHWKNLHPHRKLPGDTGEKGEILRSGMAAKGLRNLTETGDGRFLRGRRADPTINGRWGVRSGEKKRGALTPIVH